MSDKLYTEDINNIAADAAEDIATELEERGVKVVWDELHDALADLLEEKYGCGEYRHQIG